MKMKIWLNAITCVLIIMLSGPASAIRYVELYKGLPNYEMESVFTVIIPNAHRDLRTAMTRIPLSNEQCKIGDINVPIGENWSIDIKSNICDNNTFHNIKALVKKLAPRLDSSRITLWATNIDNNTEIDLLVGYFDIANDNDAPYPYLSIWCLKFENERYRAIMQVHF